MGTKVNKAHESTHVAGGSDDIDSALALAAMADLTTDKIWKGVAGRPAEVDVPVGATVVRKTADKTLNNVAVLENDNHLLLVIGANEVWQIDIFILCQGNEAADIQLGFAYPVGCVIKWAHVGAGASNSIFTWGRSAAADIPKLVDETGTSSIGIDGDDVTGYRLSLIVINGANAGTLYLQWAQNAATVGDTKVLENSCLIAHQLL